MATLHQVVEELQYSNLQQEEHTERLEEIELVMMELNETFTRSFQGFVDTFTAKLDVSVEDLSENLNPISETSTEDQREARDIAMREALALSTTADFVEKIYGLMLQADERAEQEANELNIPGIVPLGRFGGVAPVGAPDKDDDKDKDKTNKKTPVGAAKTNDRDDKDKRKPFKIDKAKIMKGGIVGGIALLGLDALGIDPADIGKTIIQAYDDVLAEFKNKDMAGAASVIADKVDSGINGLVDLLFADEPQSDESIVGMTAVAAGAGFVAGGPLGAFLAGMTMWISQSFTADEVVAAKDKMVGQLASFIGGITELLTNSEARARAAAEAFTKGGYDRALEEAAPDELALTISEVGLDDAQDTKLDTPEQVELTRQQDILAALQSQLDDRMEDTVDAARDYDMQKYEYDYAKEHGTVKGIFIGNENAMLIEANDLKDARREYEEAQQSLAEKQMQVDRQAALVQNLVNQQSSNTTIEVTKGHIDQKGTNQPRK